MAVAENLATQSRWIRTLRGAATFADDLGSMGAWVGPRTGPDKRNQGQKEDYVLRRLVVAWKHMQRLPFPVEIRAERDAKNEPDFHFNWPNETTLGVEVTEAGDENYQAWLTRTSGPKGLPPEVPIEASTEGTAATITQVIRKKVENYDSGSYREQSACDLVVFDNTAWGGFLDKGKLLEAIGRPNDLLGRFRQIHLVTSGPVMLDILGSDFARVDVRGLYEIDFAEWIFDQVEKLRRGAAEQLDMLNIAEELATLGRTERRALAGHIRNLFLHLLKWQFQPERRSESWRLTIDNARSEIHELLTEMPSLKSDLATLAGTEFPRARKEAAKETGLSLTRLPETSPYELTQLVNPEFYPGS